MKVRLGEVARESRETLRGSKRGLPVVGLEHITPSELTLTEWAIDSENTFTKAFRKGQILFGRRRAYLKKAAVAPFDGICSGDITVIEAIPEKLLLELLPFVIQNDTFFDYAVGKSAGSLSPRVKWEHLQNFEFTLPPVAEQRKLADLLWTANATREAYKKLLVATDDLIKSQFIEMFGDPVTNPKRWEMKLLGDICDLKAGKFISASDIISEYQDNLYPCYGGNGLRGYVENYSHEGEYPLIGRQGALCGNIQFTKGKFYATEHAVVVRPLVDIDTQWLSFILDHLNLNKLSMGAAQPGLTVGRLNQVEIIISPISLQNRFANFVRQADKSKFELQRTIDELEATYKSLLRENLG